MVVLFDKIMMITCFLLWLARHFGLLSLFVLPLDAYIYKTDISNEYLHLKRSSAPPPPPPPPSSPSPSPDVVVSVFDPDFDSTHFPLLISLRLVMDYPGNLCHLKFFSI